MTKKLKRSAFVGLKYETFIKEQDWAIRFYEDELREKRISEHLDSIGVSLSERKPSALERYNKNRSA